MGVKWFTTQEIGGQMKLQLRSGMHHWSWPQSSPKTAMSSDRMTLFHQTGNTLQVNVSKQLLKESSNGINSLEYRMEKEADRRVERLTLRPCRTDSQGAQLACCAGGLGLPEGCGQVGQALSANDCSPPAAFSSSSCWAVCRRPEETLESQIRTRKKEQANKEEKNQRASSPCADLTTRERGRIVRNGNPC